MLVTDSENNVLSLHCTECRYGPQTYPEDMRPVMWAIAMAGGYANWYLGTTAWDVIVPGDVAPGYAYCRHLVKFFTQASYWLLEPNDGLVTTTVSLPRLALRTPGRLIISDCAKSCQPRPHGMNGCMRHRACDIGRR